MRKRRTLTVEDVFNKQKYQNILYLIIQAFTSHKKIKFCHLRYALCKNHGLKISSKRLGDLIDSEIHALTKYGWLNKENKFSSYQTLGNAISRLKKLGLIESIPDKKGYDYYGLTPKGYIKYLSWFIHKFIDKQMNDNVEKLEELQQILFMLYWGITIDEFSEIMQKKEKEMYNIKIIS